MATTVDDPNALTAYRNLYDQAGAEMADARRRYEGLISSQQERALYDQFSSNWDRYEQASSRLIRLIDAGRQQEAVTELAGNDLFKLYTAASDVLMQVVALNRGRPSGMRTRRSARPTAPP
ncbi:hypothetical protein GCM10025880_02100 [Methylorubrum aminovorans]|nr:hypothetical protein GCM10025880_02100 [Methylorubrum aminovorans]